MLPLWFGYGDFDGECESAVEDDRQDHVFPVVFCFYWHLIFTFLFSSVVSFCSLSWGL